MKTIQNLFETILQAGIKKEIYVFFKSESYDPIKGFISAMDQDLKWILMESNDDYLPDEQKDDPLCFLININDISHISYFKCNGTGGKSS